MNRDDDQIPLTLVHIKNFVTVGFEPTYSSEIGRHNYHYSVGDGSVKGERNRSK